MKENESMNYCRYFTIHSSKVSNIHFIPLGFFESCAMVEFTSKTLNENILT